MASLTAAESAAAPLFDVLTATASELQGLLTAGKVSSAQLVQVYLDQIAKHNGYLKGVMCTAPVDQLRSRARSMDQERSQGKTRSALHGIPVLVKDNIATHPDLGMDTTAGSLALVGSRPREHAEIVKRILDAGMIIIGKASLSEWSYWKGEGLFCGWSAVGGQGQSPYIRGGLDLKDAPAGHSSCGGSSSGPGISVAAGFAPIAIGTETIGSLVNPSGRAALYTIKPTIGLVSQQGIVPISALFDSAGPMTKSVLDLANLMDAIVDPARTRVPQGGYASLLQNLDWSEMRIGTLDPSEWEADKEIVGRNEDADKQMNDAYLAACAKVQTLAKSLRPNVPLEHEKNSKLDGDGCVVRLIRANFRQDLEGYLSGLESSQVRTLDELVKFNRDHADRELPPDCPSQKRLEDALDYDLMPEARDMLLEQARRLGRSDGIDKIMKEHDVNIIIGPAESPMCGIASASGYPVATLPLGYLDFNGRPFALAALAGEHQEALLIKLQGLWEATFPPRQPPPRENFDF